MDPFLSRPAVDLYRSPSRTIERNSASARAEAEVLSLFDTLHAALLRFTISLGLGLQDGEDVLQEAFLALFRHLLQDRSRSNLKGWLFSVTHNLALDRRKSVQVDSRRHEPSPDLIDICPDPAPIPEEVLAFSERQTRLRSVLQALPERDRLCLQLRGEGLRYREISRIVGISVGSVASSLTRSLAKLAGIDRR